MCVRDIGIECESTCVRERESVFELLSVVLLAVVIKLLVGWLCLRAQVAVCFTISGMILSLDHFI